MYLFNRMPGFFRVSEEYLESSAYRKMSGIIHSQDQCGVWGRRED
jgi:hypothetical protein